MARSSSAPATEATSLPSGGDAFDSRRLQMLVSFSSSLRWQMISTALVTAGVVWAGGGPLALVALWLAATIAIREFRAALLLRLGSDAAQPIAQRLATARLWTLLLGLAYGSAAFFMVWLEPAAAAILTMVLMSLSAGAVSTTFSVVEAFIAFAGGIAVPTALMWFAGGGWIGWGVGALVLMFMAVQVKFARQNMQLFAQSYAMRLENQALLQELSQERQQLSTARDLAVEADLTKSRFLAAASHDLRQPLQSLLLNSGALSRMPLDGESRAIVSDIIEGIEHLRQMLDALLDVSQLDAGAVAPRLQAVALAELLEAVCARFRPTAAAKGLQLSHECASGLAVTSDAQMLRRILANLIDNAIKYTLSGSVTLAAQADPQRPGFVRLTVADTGVGIDPGDRDRVFEDLVQLHNPQRDRAAGMGLGLGIVRRLAQVLGIEYEVDSRQGEGTRFVLQLPAAGGDAPVVASHSHGHPGLVARRVLVLDDNAQLRESYANALGSLGCKVVGAATVQQALDALANLDPEVALVDFRLAEPCDGLQAIERLRAVRPTLAAALVTADATLAMRERAARLGVAVLRKPVTDTMLAMTINDALHEMAGRSAQNARAAASP